jgi:molybdopterin molybdotransferase
MTDDRHHKNMIPFGEAFKIVLGSIVLSGVERIAMPDATGRILAEDIRSDIDMPPFNKSAVDGYACRIADLATDKPDPISLQVIETVSAGILPARPITPGKCSRIMTGAMIPEGADCVVMVEDTVETGKDQICLTLQKNPQNICYRGEDIRTGDVVLKKGTMIRPVHMATLATVGAMDILVSELPEVGILSTGDELVEPDQIPTGSKIRNSNAGQLLAQVKSIPAIADYLGISPDDKKKLLQKINDGLEKNDVLLITGGVSMGDFDFVPAIMAEAGIEIVFKSIAIQPGRPTVFGKKGKKIVFGLPGNPVSSFVLFEILVRPFLLAMMGCTDRPPVVILPLGKGYSRRKSERQSLIPVRIENGVAFPIEYHGSAHISAYSTAHGIISIGIGETEIQKGTMVHVRFI